MRRLRPLVAGLIASTALTGLLLFAACASPDAEVPVAVALPQEAGPSAWAAFLGTDIKGLVLSVREGIPGQPNPDILGKSFYDATPSAPPAMSVHGLVGGDNRYVVLEGVDVGAAALATRGEGDYHVLARGSTVPASYAPTQSAIPSGSSYPKVWMFLGRVDRSNLLGHFMTTPRAFFCGADLGAGEVVLAGGLDDTGLASGEIELFQRDQFLFMHTYSLKSSRAWSSCVPLPEGGALTAGGIGSNGSLSSTAERLTPQGASLAGSLDLGFPQTYGAAAPARINGAPHVIIAGGSSTRNVTDPVSNIVFWDGVTLSPYDPLNLPRSFLSATGLPDGRVFLAGGYFKINLGVVTQGVAGSGEILDDLASYHLTSVSGLRPRWAHSATLVRTSSDGVLLVGGAETLVATTGGWPDHGAAVAGFDLILPRATGSPAIVVTSGSLHLARAQHSAATFGDGDVLICGGTPVAGLTPAEGVGPLDSCEIWRHRTGAVDTAGSMVLPRLGHQAFDLHDGSVLIVGGIGVTGEPTNLAEIYVPRWPDER